MCWRDMQHPYIITINNTRLHISLRKHFSVAFLCKHKVWLMRWNLGFVIFFYFLSLMQIVCLSLPIHKVIMLVLLKSSPFSLSRKWEIRCTMYRSLGRLHSGILGHMQRRIIFFILGIFAMAFFYVRNHSWLFFLVLLEAFCLFLFLFKLGLPRWISTCEILLDI